VKKMQIDILIAILILLLGFPVGNFLAKMTREELKDGKVWFKLIMLTCVIGTIASLVIRNDVLLFGFLFIMIVTSRSLLKKIKDNL
jgi:hypothetical protein